MLGWVIVAWAVSSAPEGGVRTAIMPPFLRRDVGPALSSGERTPQAATSGTEPEDAAAHEKSAHEKKGEPSDLTIRTFFSDGWDQDWVKRSRNGRAPDMALLRVTTNFLERELRLDYAYTRNVKNSTKVDDSRFLNALIAYGLNRRLMIEIISNYQWNEPPADSTASKENGAAGAALVRFQLADTFDQSYAFQVRVSAPNRGIGQTATTVSPSVAGFQDLQTLLGLDRVGLYESMTYDGLTGPHAAGARTRSVSYDVSLAKTWTAPEAYPVGRLTSFLELFATTDLNGDAKYHTGMSLTPGARFWFSPDNSLTMGVDLPVSQPHQFDEAFRLTYILTF